MSNPHVACLCPTFNGKPARLINNAIACFQAQTYPEADRFLFVFDDTGHFSPAEGDHWGVTVSQQRCESLPRKYHAMVDMAKDFDVIVVWDDDDIYLPNHIEASVNALAEHEWSHPSTILSLYTGRPLEEGSAGRFHGALAMRRESLLVCGNWPDTARADFDQQMLGNLRIKYGAPGDPYKTYGCSYIYRWGTVKAPHSSGFGSAPGDSKWWDRIGHCKSDEGDRSIRPCFDAETNEMMELYSKAAFPK